MQKAYNRKGQLTVFIILGIVILFVFGILLLYPKLKLSSVPPPYQWGGPKSVQGAYEQCATQTFHDVLTTIGQNGGYAIIPNELQVEGAEFAYWYKDTDSSRSIMDLKRDIETLFASQLMIDCDYISFAARTIGIAVVSTGDLQLNVSLNEQDVSAQIYLPFTATQANVQAISVPMLLQEQIPLSHIISDIQKIVEAYEIRGEVFSNPQCMQRTINIISLQHSLIINYTAQTGVADNSYTFWFALEKNNNENE